MILRPGDPSDAAAIAELWFDSWMSSRPSHQSVTRADLAERARNEICGRWEVIVADVDRRLVGFLALAPAEKRLDQLFVAPDAQGHGIGASLLRAACARLPGGFWLSADAGNIRAIAFYEREGLTRENAAQSQTVDRVIFAFRP